MNRTHKTLIVLAIALASALAPLSSAASQLPGVAAMVRR